MYLLFDISLHAQTNLSIDPLELKDVLPSLEQAHYVFLPINDNDDVDLAEGGSHWSLLIVDLQKKEGFYYDTLDDTNVAPAEVVAKKLAILDNCPQFTLYSLPTPQQTNGSDCGVMVCMLTSHFLRKILDMQSSDTKKSIEWHVEDNLVSAKRGRHLLSYAILDLISKYGRKIGSSEEIGIKLDANKTKEDSSSSLSCGTTTTTENDQSEDSESAVPVDISKAIRRSHHLHLHRRNHGI